MARRTVTGTGWEYVHGFRPRGTMDSREKLRRLSAIAERDQAWEDRPNDGMAQNSDQIPVIDPETGEVRTWYMNRVFLPLLETEGDFDIEFGRWFPPSSPERRLGESAPIEAGHEIEDMMRMAGMTGYQKLDPEAFERFEQQVKARRRRSVILFTVFLPVMLTLSFLGPAIVGLGAAAAFVGFFVGTFTQNWWVVGVCVYWWVGANLARAELRHRGH